VALTVVESISSTSDSDTFVRQTELLPISATSFIDTLAPDLDASAFTEVLKSPYVLKYGEMELSGSPITCWGLL